MVAAMACRQLTRALFEHALTLAQAACSRSSCNRHGDPSHPPPAPCLLLLVLSAAAEMQQAGGGLLYSRLFRLAGTPALQQLLPRQLPLEQAAWEDGGLRV
jgi:hypothetical protein